MKKKKPKPQMTKRGLGVWHGRAAQSLGGVSRGGEVTHFVEAHYLWTPDQQQQQQKHQNVHEKVQVSKKKPKQNPQNCNDGDEEGTCCRPRGDKEPISSDEATTTAEAVTDTRSSVTAHSIRNYLMGISREAGPDQHPLIPDLPSEWLEYLEIASTR